MEDDDFLRTVKQKLADFERRTGRVPSIEELAEELGVHSRLLPAKLRRAIATIGSDAQAEGTSAFKSSLRQVLSPSLFTSGICSYREIEALMQEAQSNMGRWAELSWFMGRHQRRVVLAAKCDKKSNDLSWSMFEETQGARRLLWQNKTRDLMLIGNLVMNSVGVELQETPADDQGERRDNVRNLRPDKDESSE